ncbi:MAG TPA: hypothetical protein DCF33_20740 [Saprospirales bacterium]|nr:hypothetical protein [Saprospirales bacterium]
MQMQQKIAAFVALSLFLTLSSSTHAQRSRDRKKEEKESPQGFTSKLWYGGGVIVGLGGFNGYSSFNFGLSPMVGYKIVGPLSVGPRVAYDLISNKQRGFKAINLHSFDVGGFVRCRVFRGLFVQGEVSNQWFQNFDPNTGDKFSDERVNQRLGAGWNFGSPGGSGSEISLMYNFRIANDINTWQTPMEYRFGFTWKF